MKYLLLSLLFFTALSGQVCFPNGWVLKFSVSEPYLNLALTLTPETLEDFDYVALGFKLPSDPAGMEGADISVVNLLTVTPTDTYAEGNGVPTLDTDLGGEDNNLNPALDGETLTFSWQRPLKSNDVALGLDKEFIEGNTYAFVWASGKIVNGVLQYHGNNRGAVIVTLAPGEYGCGEEFLQLNAGL